MIKKVIVFIVQEDVLINYHKFRDYILKDIFEEKTIILEDLKKRYYYSQNQLLNENQLFNRAKDELYRINTDFFEVLNTINNSINLLNEIALDKSIFESIEQHIDLLIEVEQSECKSGWNNRVQGLYLLKEEKRKLREIIQGNNPEINIFKQIREKGINECLNLDI